MGANFNNPVLDDNLPMFYLEFNFEFLLFSFVFPVTYILYIYRKVEEILVCSLAFSDVKVLTSYFIDCTLT